MCKAFATTVNEDLGKNTSPFLSNLCEAVLEEAKDTAKDDLGLMERGCPSRGGDYRFRARCAFPEVSKQSTAVEVVKAFCRMMDKNGWKEEEHGNYKSSYTEGGVGNALVEAGRMIRNEFVAQFS